MPVLTSIEGIYKDGKVELAEVPEDVREARVIVTFLPVTASHPTLSKLTPQEIEEMRWRLQAFEEDWNAPGMEAYDDM